MLYRPAVLALLWGLVGSAVFALAALAGFPGDESALDGARGGIPVFCVMWVVLGTRARIER